jgi:hypothetical protein
MFDWYKVGNVTEFEATGLVSQEFEFELGDLGIKTVLLTKGNYVGVTYEGIFLAAHMNDSNPFEFEGHAVYVDPTSQDIFLGIEVEE